MAGGPHSGEYPMKIFLSSLPIEVLKALNVINPELNPNVLITYYGLTNQMDYVSRHRSLIGSLIMDCGAFSLNNIYRDPVARSKESNKLFAKYKFDAPLIQSNYDFLFSFDDAFDPDSFEHNLERLHDLESNGVRAVPVVHNLANEEVDYYIDHGYKVIAIGQCQGQNRENLEILWPVVDKLYSAGVRTHLFGMTSPGTISHVPAYSCDAKTWIDYAARGRVLFWNPENPKLDKTDLVYFPKNQKFPDDGPGTYYHDYPHLDAFKEYIGGKLCIELRDLLGLQREMYRKLVNVLYFLELEEMITINHRAEGIKFD